MLGEPPPNSPSLLRAQIQGQIFLLAIRLPQTSFLRLTDDSQYLGDGQSYDLDLRKLVGRTSCHLSYPQKSQLRLQLLQLIKEFGLALRPQLVNLDLSHDEELLQLARWRDNNAGSKSRQERTTTLLSKISSGAA
jgi:hypothetical protein